MVNVQLTFIHFTLTSKSYLYFIGKKIPKFEIESETKHSSDCPACVP